MLCITCKTYNTNPMFSQVYPKRLLDNGFRFKHPEVTEAIANAISWQPSD